MKQKFMAIPQIGQMRNQEQALCSDPKYPPETWFPHERASPRDYEKAYAVCRQCPVIMDCLEYACRVRLATSEIAGVWAGRPPTFFKNRTHVAQVLADVRRLNGQQAKG